jgi:hypothetical protein
VTIASVHVSDVGTARAVAMLRGPGRVPGLLSANAAIAAPLRTGSLPKPMPGRIALVAFWQDHAALDAFLAQDTYARRLDGGWWARLELVRAHGTWPGLPDDVERSRASNEEGPAVVLTLGRLRLRHVRPFLRASQPAEVAALKAPGFRWGTGLARPPFVSTLSLWESGEAAASYAYGSQPDAHVQAIGADRKIDFHRQSAFVRFRPVEVGGQLGGRNPLSPELVQPA